ncbi:chromosome segregation ATPase [Actinomadura graeca]|uniref:Chromosome segregation ATPase n=1 Tax=Actinomadura graeca TaxID=2750812 RepID=A0ABX8R9A3_9ACTN|nr:chromosome segregation ATPase [Actinomadura graeca]QXJ25568.1 chromosome segregation ATPase [Actinomadura graeca]
MKDQKVAPFPTVTPTPASPTMTDLPIVPDPAAGENAPAREPRDGNAPAGEPVAIWPCAGCGRPVPQPVRGARTVRYCEDSDGGCERAAHAGRDDARDAPGLTGQVAWTWEMVERLESVADRLAGSLTAELSVAGVERRVAEARAEAAEQIAVAQRERDASQRRAELAWRDAATARSRAEAAESELSEIRAEAARAATELDVARQERQEAEDVAEASAAARLAAESDRNRVAAREGELVASLESARADLVALHARVAESQTRAEERRAETEIALRTAEDLRSAVRDAEAKRGQAVADRDQIQARASEFEQHNWQLARIADELRAAVKALTSERDAARAEADRARRQVDALTRPPGPRQAPGPPGPRPGIDREPPTGLHPLGPFNGAPTAADPRRRNGQHLPNSG